MGFEMFPTGVLYIVCFIVGIVLGVVVGSIICDRTLVLCESTSCLHNKHRRCSRPLMALNQHLECQDFQDISLLCNICGTEKQWCKCPHCIDPTSCGVCKGYGGKHICPKCYPKEFL